MKLTDKQCKNAQPKDKTYKLSDGGGLYLEITSAGGKYWRYKYRMGDKEKRLALGVYPETSLLEARAKHREAHKHVKEGIDPAQVKQSEKQQRLQDSQNTFELIAREWHKMKVPEWSEVNAQTTLARLEKDVFPVIGKTPIKDISPQILLDLAGTVKQRGAHELAKRIIQMSKHIFQYAIITERADKNPAANLSGYVRPPSPKHFAAIEARDLPKFLHDLEEHRPQLNRATYLALKFMMLTFVRTSEMIKAEWDEFDFKDKIWLIPAKRMKMNRDHFVPLSKQAIDILNELRNMHQHPYYVFPSRNDSRKHMSNNTILMALDRMGYRGTMTGHGFRSLALSTIKEKLGYQHEVPDLQLAHAKKGDVNRAYDRAQFLDQRTVMMQDWADYLDEIGKTGTVIAGNFKWSA